MTDRLKGVVVTFDKSIREDDAEPILEAIRMIRCVFSVKPVVDDFNDRMNRERLKSDLANKFLSFYKHELMGLPKEED